MINREITYQRNVTGSYMKIPILRINEFDEMLILKRKLPGLIPVERCYVNGQGQYWYQISGKQSLDTYSKIQAIGIDFIEKVILSICSEIEILEWNLFDTNCLQLEPELVFVSNVSHEILFCLYPENQQKLGKGFQQLMEYLLTRIDHTDESAVHTAYEIYERTLDEGYSILDIRDFIIQRRQEKLASREILEKNEKKEKREEKKAFIDNRTYKDNRNSKENRSESWKESGNGKEKFLFMNEGSSLETIWLELIKRWNCWKESLNIPVKTIQKRKEESGEEDFVIEAEDYYEEPEEIHPTICIAGQAAQEEGLLLYEGKENFKDFRIEGESSIIGKGNDVGFLIGKDTVSRHHAKLIHATDGYYIEDLNSTNGTFVNDVLLNYKERRKLESNDLISFGDVKYRFI